jgi:esterase/lipase superfamily enzyme
MLHRLTVGAVLLLLTATLSGCGSMSGLVAPARAPDAADAGPRLQRVFVASSRAADVANDARSDTLTYMSYAVSVPPGHQTGRPPQQINFHPTAARDFVVDTGETYGSAASFDSAVASHARRAFGAPEEAFVFVHGFNTDFFESVYQLAQIGHDIAIPASMVLYAWPSNGHLFDYVHDLDSVAFARDGLERVLDDLAASGVKRITVVGYSMGAALVMETMRQMKLVGSPQFFAHLGGVVLLSPDMDIDLFRIEAERMGGLPQPFVIYGAPKDFALELVSRYLAANEPRLGSLPDPGVLAAFKLTYVDVTNVPHYRQPGHLPIATSPTIIDAINALPRADLVRYAQTAAAGGVPGANVTRYGNLTYVRLAAVAP